MPVLRTSGEGGKPAWRFYAPLSLPAGGAELASAVLHHTVWITPSDGHVHPAPCTRPSTCSGATAGVTGPASRGRRRALLDDLDATMNLREHRKVPKGLTALFNEEHKRGSELARSTLLHARMTLPRTH
ncbi:hypothetical protein ACFYW6_39335 [Streptomyces sp. NPDC002659]|uniref:hypothetical protein n=1 Tax=Streptomyces sp. NPDC002659 TaxID=3364656 RepID=UPI0036C48CC4